MSRIAIILGIAFGLAAFGTDVVATVQIDLVTVGNLGNTPDTRYDMSGYGGVGYAYNIGKYEVTNAQYAEFLNAVAQTDTHLLYHSGMAGAYGGIARSGTAGSYSYSILAGRGNMPVNFACFWDASRFTNWMHNGQPMGLQDLTTTESGAYLLDGVTYPLNTSITRIAGARFFLPSEDEWYKAAYYDPDLNGGAGGYWDYATRSNTPPTSEAPPGTDLVNGSANCGWAVGNVTGVGAYVAMPSVSAYGTFDQAGNLSEWNEGITWAFPTKRCVRGGSWRNSSLFARAGYRGLSGAGAQADIGGFRVGGQIPEPSTLGLLVLGSLAFVRLRRARKGSGS